MHHVGEVLMRKCFIRCKIDDLYRNALNITMAKFKVQANSEPYYRTRQNIHQSAYFLDDLEIKLIDEYFEYEYDLGIKLIHEYFAWCYTKLYQEFIVHACKEESENYKTTHAYKNYRTIKFQSVYAYQALFTPA